MVRKFEDAIKISISAYERNRASLPDKLNKEAVNHFKDSFRKQGWLDRVLTRWQNRKFPDVGRAILVLTGRLRRSFDNIVTYRRITIINDTPYSAQHNYGNKKRGIPARKFMGKSQVLNEKSGVIIMRMIKRALR